MDKIELQENCSKSCTIIEYGGKVKYQNSMNQNKDNFDNFDNFENTADVEANQDFKKDERYILDFMSSSNGALPNNYSKKNTGNLNLTPF